MGNTYAMVNERKKEWLRQWAKIMLIVEQSVSRKERLAQQWNYSKKMPDGSRILVTRLIQTVSLLFCLLFNKYFLFDFKADERENIENMRTDYFHQLRKHLEPESSSQQSKTKVVPVIASLRPSSATKTRQELFRNQVPQESFGSLDTTALI